MSSRFRFRFLQKILLKNLIKEWGNKYKNSLENYLIKIGFSENVSGSKFLINSGYINVNNTKIKKGKFKINKGDILNFNISKNLLPSNLLFLFLRNTWLKQIFLHNIIKNKLSKFKYKISNKNFFNFNYWYNLNLFQWIKLKSGISGHIDLPRTLNLKIKNFKKKKIIIFI